MWWSPHHWKEIKKCVLEQDSGSQAENVKELLPDTGSV